MFGRALIGVAGFVGTMLIGCILKRGPYGTLAIIPSLRAQIALTLIPFGGEVATVVTLLGLWDLMATAAPVGW